MENQELSEMCKNLWFMIKKANFYMDQQAPWHLRKSNKIRMKTVLNVLTEFIRQIGILAQPIIPQAAEKILDQLCVAREDRLFNDIKEKYLKEGTLLPKPEIVFPRV